MPEIPNMHALASMLLTVLALALFSRSGARLEKASIALIAVLAAGFTLFPFGNFRAAQFFAGFGHEALIAVCALMILGQGLMHTGALEPLGRLLSRFWVKSPSLSFAAMLLIAGALSAFINNTPIVVLLLPILISVCLRTASSPSKILMPMGFATLIGGMCTTIGTSTNLLVVSVAANLGLPPFGMFDFLYPAALACAVGLLYLGLIAPRLLPERDSRLTDASPRLFEARLRLNTGSAAVGRTLSEAIAMAGGSMRVSRIRREGTFILPLPDVKLKDGDRLRVIDTPQRLKTFEDKLNATLHSADHVIDEDHPLSADDQVLAEIAVMRGSSLDLTNLRFAQFIDRHRLAALALHRAGREIWRLDQDLEDVHLRGGDILLVQGAREQIAALKRDRDFLVLDASIDLPSTKRAPLALAITVAIICLAGAGLLPIAVAAVLGVAGMLLSRCLTVSAAIRAINPSVLFVVVASLALGKALIETGAAQYITELFLFATAGAGPVVILGALMLLLALLTNLVSNNAAAIIGTPIAIGIARQLSLPPEPFVLAVLFGANMSYVTPFAYQTNLLVMSAGNYRFAEFVKVGLPLTALMLITLTLVLSALYL